MELRALGRTGRWVSVLGLGTGPLGDARLDDAEVGALLNAALDAGVTLVDTAPSHGLSEERTGRYLAHRRAEYVLSTRCGCGVPGVEDWTGRCIAQGIDLALLRLRTDVLDVVHLHSCPVDVLERPGVVDALEAAVRAGKVRVAAYSGDGAALEHAVDSGRFASVQPAGALGRGRGRELARTRVRRGSSAGRMARSMSRMKAQS
jgi:aryl-alcohol dehydrogenase-like predicted oxidoreductase